MPRPRLKPLPSDVSESELGNSGSSEGGSENNDEPQEDPDFEENDAPANLKPCPVGTDMGWQRPRSKGQQDDRQEDNSGGGEC